MKSINVINKYICICVYCCCCFILNSQVIKVENGITFTSMDSKRIKLMNEQIKTYSFLLGVDYCDYKYFNMSTELGYLSKGGREKDFDTGDYIYEKWNYLHVNTTFRVKYPFDSVKVYFGIGPKVDILLDSNVFNYSLYEGYKLNKFTFGLKPEIGFNQQISKDIQVGLNCSCLLNLTNVGYSKYNVLKNNLFLLTLVVGYVL